MGSYGEDVCLDCSWCGKWEGSISHTDVDGIGLLCLRCKHFGPPHFEYLLGLLKDHLLERLVIKIAAFVYEPCAITEISALVHGFTNEDDFECEFCDESWIGWHCQYCLKIS
jgi:hypothetical protein